MDCGAGRALLGRSQPVAVSAIMPSDLRTRGEASLGHARSILLGGKTCVRKSRMRKNVLSVPGALAHVVAASS